MSVELNKIYLPVEIEMEKLVESEDNPNTQDELTFNRLVESMRKDGFDENLIVVPMADGKYKIVSGHHRFRAAKILGYLKVPCVIREDFDEDKRKFELVKRNLLRGKVDITKLADLYKGLNKKYSDDALSELMALDESTFKRIVSKIRESLPKEMRKDFDKSKDEIKTIKDLSLVLNKLFTMYGDTLDSNFMVFDFDGKNHLWIRCDSALWKQANEIADFAKENGNDINNIIADLFDEFPKLYGHALKKEGDQ